jgi:hypothetical protein
MDFNRDENPTSEPAEPLEPIFMMHQLLVQLALIKV